MDLPAFGWPTRPTSAMSLSTSSIVRDTAFFARLPLARRLVRGRREERVSLSAAPALGDENLISVGEHLAQHLAAVDVAHDRSRRNGQHDVLTRPSRLVVPRSVIATLGRPLVAIGVVEERREIVVPAHVHVATATAVATIGTAQRDELLAAERRDARAAVAAAHLDLNAIDERGHARRTRAQSSE